MATVQRLACLLFVGLLCFAPQAEARTDSKTFSVSPGGTLDVDTDRGSIKIETHNRSEVEINVLVSGSKADNFDVEFNQQGDTVSVRGDLEGSSSWSWFGNSLKVEFTITVPKEFDVVLQTSGGSIRVSDLDGEVHAKTSGGSLYFGDIRGTVEGKTSGGSITLEGAQGDTHVKTSGGSINIGDVDGRVEASTSGGSIHIDQARGEVTAKTSGGSIRVDEVGGTLRAETSGGSVTAYISQQPAADCRLSTSGGRVEVYLADGIAVDVDAHSSGGRVSSDFPVSGGTSSKTSLRGEINGGGPQLYLRSSGGGVRIERR